MTISDISKQQLHRISELFIDEIECVRQHFSDLALLNDDELVTARCYADQILENWNDEVPENTALFIEYLDFLFWSVQIKMEIVWRTYGLSDCSEADIN